MSRNSLDLAGLTTYPLRDRKSLVTAVDFATLPEPISGFERFLESLPNIYSGRDFRSFIDRLREAREKGRPVLFAIGGHVIKCGLSPVIIDLMEKGFITGIAMTGAGAIHDYEVAVVGQTSEDVSQVLGAGQFGMAQETFEAVNGAARDAAKKDLGFGEALGKRIAATKEASHPQLSISAAAVRLGLPVTIHVALGTDIVHMHHEADGAAIGEATLGDFRRICDIVSNMDGGVWANVGCAVILPEVFLKAVSVVRNLGYSLDHICTANLDMIRHYRPETNVVRRPPGVGYSLAGQHEILLPLIRMCLLGGKQP